MHVKCYLQNANLRSSVYLWSPNGSQTFIDFEKLLGVYGDRQGFKCRREERTGFITVSWRESQTFR